MAMTRDDRSTYTLCGAKRRNGEPCRLFAGQGTNHKGVGRCRLHGGATRNHTKHAAKVEAERRLMRFGEPLEVDPVEAMLTMLRLAAGHVAYLRQQLDAVGDH